MDISADLRLHRCPPVVVDGLGRPSCGLAAYRITRLFRVSQPHTARSADQQTRRDPSTTFSALPAWTHPSKLQACTTLLPGVLASVAAASPRESGAEPAGGHSPPYLWRDPRLTVRGSSPHPSAWRRAGPQPRSRWSARWTNDLDRGADRRRLLAVEEGASAVVQFSSRAAPGAGAVADGCRNHGEVRGRPALSRCTQLP